MKSFNVLAKELNILGKTSTIFWLFLLIRIKIDQKIGKFSVNVYQREVFFSPHNKFIRNLQTAIHKNGLALTIMTSLTLIA
jgi:hypothetical protein